MDAGIGLALICTRPARRSGRGSTVQPSPVERTAVEYGIPVITPERLDRDTVQLIKATQADVYIVAAYGKLIPSDLLKAPRLGVTNLHPSLLPRHRGPSPVATAILEGDEFTGVSIMLLDQGMDTGPILAQSDPVPVTDRIRSDELTETLFKIGADMLPDVLEQMNNGKIMPVPQDAERATVTKLIKKSDGEIDWTLSADKIARMNRAYHPWPGTFTFWNGVNLKIVDIDKMIPSHSVDRQQPSVDRQQPGLVTVNADGMLLVATGDGNSVSVTRLQLAGRQAMRTSDFLKGRPDIDGTVLDS